MVVKMKKFYVGYILLTLLVYFNQPFVFSQVKPPAKGRSAQSAAAASSSAASKGQMGKLDAASQTIDILEFKEVDIKDVLRQLAKQYDLNIIFSESVSGLVTVQLKNVTIDEALDAIISINGFVYTKKDGVIKVTTAQEAGKEGKQTRVFRLNNADATALKASLQKVISSDGSIDVDARSNSLIVTDIPRVINNIAQMIQENLDSITPQVLIEARFIEATEGTTEKLGVDWSPSDSTKPQIQMNGASSPTLAPFTQNLENQLSKLVPSSSPQVVNGSPTATTPTFPATNSFPYVDTSSSGVGSFAYGTMNFSQLQVALDFIKTQSGSKIISSPRIVTVDNKQAHIQVGETRRIRTSKTDNTTATGSGVGTTTQYTYDKEDVGIILTVLPHVTPDGHIHLVLQPEVSSADTVDADNIAIIQKRIAQTEVIIKDGQTIVIGGLTETKKNIVTTKVPVMGDIPFLGRLFSHNTNTPSKDELLIFVTARVIRENEKGAAAFKSGIITSPPRVLKTDLREVRPMQEPKVVGE
jgi:type IV pilus assembly protein PilQ